MGFAQQPSIMPLPTKRKRDQGRLEKLKQYGVDLTDIPGLPVQVIPLQVHAFQRTVKFFRDANALVHPSRQQQQQETSVQNTSLANSSQTQALESQHVLEGIFNRIEEQQSHLPHADTLASCTHSHLGLQQAIDSWLEAIHRFHRESTRNNDQSQSGSSVSIPLASFKHLYETFVNSDGTQTIIRRRAALHLGAQLLWKSCDCRQWLLESRSYLEDFIECVQQSATSQEDRRTADIENKRHLLQREAYLVLCELADRGYRSLYPTLMVGLQRFEQQCPRVSSGTVVVGQSDMATWRRNRDLALEHYQQEDKRVKKLLKHAYRCLDVLVPRLIDDSEHTTDEAAEEGENDDDDDDDGDIDWEDGISLPREDIHRPEDNADAHALAVERTLVMMQSTAAVQNGEIQISLENAPPVLASSTAAAESSLQARQNLTRYVTIFSTKHLPRLSAWIEGLANADNLAASSEGTLIALCRSLLDRRADATRSLLENKQAIAAVLASANKLCALSLKENQQSSQLQSASRSLHGAASSRGQVFGRSERPTRSKIHIKLR